MKKITRLWVVSFLVITACSRLVTLAPDSKVTPIKQSLPTASVYNREEYPPSLSPVTPSIDLLAIEESSVGQIAHQHILALSETIGPRVAGSVQEAEAARYIQKVLQDYGYTFQLQSFSIDTDDGTGEANQTSSSSSSQNVIALKPGLSTREIVVGAHYDSVEVGSGADDNASGIGVLLEAARLIQGMQTPYSIRFIAFGAEEIDLKGSRYYVNQMSDLESQSLVAMVNLDSLIAGDITYVYGSTAPEGALRDWILERAERNSFEVQTQSGDDLLLPDGSPCDCSDYAPFQHAGIPYAYFEATNWNLGKKDGYTQVEPEYGVQGEIWHTKFDRLDYLDRTFPGRVDDHLSLFVKLLYEVLTQYKEAP